MDTQKITAISGILEELGGMCVYCISLRELGFNLEEL